MINSKYLLAIFLLIFSNAVSAEKSANSELWILTSPEPPFVVLEQDRRMTGYVVDIINGILKSAQLETQIIVAPWARVEKEARSEGNLMAFALARTAERENHYHWITPLTANVYSVYTKKSYAKSIANIKDLESFAAISVLRNDARHNILRQQGLSNLSAFESWGEALSALQKGQADAIFFSDAGINYFCHLPEYNCDSLVRVYMHQKTLSYLVLSKLGTNLQLVEKLLKAAKEYKSSAEFKSMSEHWIKKYRQEVTIPMHMEDGTLNLWNK